MSALNKGALIIISFLLIVYYGIVPLLGYEVWMRKAGDAGWITLDIKQSTFNIFIGVLIAFYLYKYGRQSQDNE
ncbi:MAG: hypothetical protein ABFS12_18060 [Bacteroidota bacterium]